MARQVRLERRRRRARRRAAVGFPVAVEHGEHFDVGARAAHKPEGGGGEREGGGVSDTQVVRRVRGCAWSAGGRSAHQAS